MQKWKKTHTHRTKLMYMTLRKPWDCSRSVTPSGYQSHLTFVSNLVQLSGQPPIGGTVGAKVLLTGAELGLLQINLCSWPQLHVLQKPVNSVDMQVNSLWLRYYSFSLMLYKDMTAWKLSHHSPMWYVITTQLAPMLSVFGSFSFHLCNPSVVPSIHLKENKEKCSLLYYWRCYSILHIVAMLHSLLKEHMQYRVRK